MSRWKTPQPDFKNPQVREYFRNNMLHWVKDVGVDGFRADVAGGVPLDFWDEARDAMDKVNPNVIMLAESDVPEHHLKAFDISYNFPYYSALTGGGGQRRIGGTHPATVGEGQGRLPARLASFCT